MRRPFPVLLLVSILVAVGLVAVAAASPVAAQKLSTSTASLDPLYHYDNVRARNSLVLLSAVSARARLLPATDLVERIALDQYAFVRDAYLQRRASLIRDGAPDPDEQTYEDYEEDKPRSEAPQDFPPFKAALLKTAPAQTQLDANIPGDLEQSKRARNGLGLLN